MKTQYEQVLKEIKETKGKIYRRDIYFWGQSILSHLHDGNSGIMTGSSFRKKSIPILHKWFHDGLYVVKSDESKLMLGDKIVAVGGRPIDELVQELGKYLPSDNEMTLRALIETRRSLADEVFLDKLGLIENKDNVTVTVEREGKRVQQIVKLQVKYISAGILSNYAQKIDKEKNYAMLKLNVFKPDREYEDVLKVFFSSVKLYKIDNVVIDLRDNSYGELQAIEMLLPYLNVEQYQSYAKTIRYSGDRPQPGEDRTGLVQVEKSSVQKNEVRRELAFDGNLYVLTSKYTYGTASFLTTLLKDNKLAQVVGETPGGNPNFYDGAGGLELPNSKLSFVVSHQQYERPDSSQGEMLELDYPVPSTVESYLNFGDDQLAFIEKLVSNKK